MAQTKTLTIESIEERTSQSGKPYWRIKVTGERQVYFVWDAALAQALLPGCTYAVTLNGTSEYPKILDVTLVPDAAPAPDTAVVSINGSAEYPRIVAVHEAPVEHEASEPVASAPAAPPAPAGDRERRMLRMSALRAAAEVLHGTGLPAEQVTAYAETLLAWLEA